VKTVAALGALAPVGAARILARESASPATHPTHPDVTSFPAIPISARPWTRWWWPGSAVSETDLTVHLEAFAHGGLGGVEITPIYGAKGYESRYVPFLSARWLELLRHTLAEARRLGLGVDLAMGTGWPFGGPGLQPTHIPWKLRFVGPSDPEPRATRAGRPAPEQIAAFPDAQGREWRVFREPTGQQVKRAAPGGEGDVLDPYSREAFAVYAERFLPIVRDPGLRPRAFFYDSFEVFGADFPPSLPLHYTRRTGRVLADDWPALSGAETGAAAEAVRADYRGVLAALLLDEGVAPWAAFCAAHGVLSRYQAHGAPGNLLDLYARADVPETEVFGTHVFPFLPEADVPATGRLPAEYPVFVRFAASAAHVAGRRLCSSETFTWHREHFASTFAELKPELDLLFLCGINHVFFHGSTFSAGDAAWPGWRFYASTHFSPLDPQWAAMPSFSAYIAACQAILQEAQPAGGVLLYFPYPDVRSKPGTLFQGCTAHNTDAWLAGTPFGDLALALLDAGVPHDYVSDAQLARCRTEGGRIISPAGTVYDALVVPEGRHMEVSALERAAEFVAAGARVRFGGSAERTVEGSPTPEAAARAAAASARLTAAGVSRPTEGLLTSLLHDATEAIPLSGIPGLSTHVFRLAGGSGVFVANLGGTAVDAWAGLGGGLGDELDLFDPLSRRRGQASVRRQGRRREVRLQLAPGESRILLPSAGGALPWIHDGPPLTRVALDGPWDVRFVSGGPTLPAARRVTELRPWNTWDDECRDFSGMARYAQRLDWRPPAGAARVRLVFPGLHAVARVIVNGREAGHVWARPFGLDVGDFLVAGANELAIEVSNLAVNRIAALERAGVKWHEFHDIGFVNRDYKPFTAADCPPRASGLEGSPEIVVLAAG
jgi:hypothetical protein